MANEKTMSDFEHQRHKPPTVLAQPRELIVACSVMRSNVNLSRIVRAASCCGVRRIIACGKPKIDPKIARDGAGEIQLEIHPKTAHIYENIKNLENQMADNQNDIESIKNIKSN